MLQPDKLKKLNENALKMAQAGKSKEDILAMKDAFITQFGTEDIEKKNPVATSTSNGPKLESVQTVGSLGGKKSNGFTKIDTNSIAPDFESMKPAVENPIGKEKRLKKELSTIKVTPKNQDEVLAKTDELSAVIKQNEEAEKLKPKNDVESFGGGLLNRLDTGIATVSKSFYDTPKMILDAVYAPQNYLAKKLDIPSLEVKPETYAFENIPSKQMDTIIANNNKKIENYKKEIGGDVVSAFDKGDYSNTFKHAALNSMESVPLIAVAMATGGESLLANSIMAGSSASTQYDQLNKEHPEMDTNTKLANAAVNGVLEVAVGKFMEGVSGNVWRSILNSKGTKETAQIATNSFKKTLEKVVGDSPLVGVAGEYAEERITDGLQQLNDIATGASSEFNWDQNKNAGLSSLGFGLPNATALYSAKAYISNKTRKRVTETSKQIIKLQNELQNPELSSENKKIISENITKIYDENKKILGSELEKLKIIPQKGREELESLDKSMSKSQSDAIDIKYDSNISEENKVLLLNNLKADFKNNLDRKNELLTKTTAVEFLPLKEQDKLKREALKELTEELNPDGKKSITITNEQITERANKNYSNQINDERTTEVTTTETKPQAEVQEQAKTEKVKREGNAIITKDNEKFTLEIFDGINGKVENIEDRENKDKFSVTIRDEKGEQAGLVTFWKDTDGKFFSNNSFVKEAYRGKGLASSIYDYAKELGIDIKPSQTQTEGGKALWEKLNREDETQKSDENISPLKKELERIKAPKKIIDAISDDVELKRHFIIETGNLLSSLITGGLYTYESSVKEGRKESIQISKLVHFFSKAEQDKTLLHEAVHAASSLIYNDLEKGGSIKYTNYQKESFYKLKTIIDNYINNASKPVKETFHYGLTNGREFMAEFISNPKFREYIGKTSENKKVNLVNYIWSEILGLLGVNKSEIDKEKLDNISKHIDDIFDTTRDYNNNLKNKIKQKLNESNSETSISKTEPQAEVQKSSEAKKEKRIIVPNVYNNKKTYTELNSEVEDYRNTEGDNIFSVTTNNGKSKLANVAVKEKNGKFNVFDSDIFNRKNIGKNIGYLTYKAMVNEANNRGIVVFSDEQYLSEEAEKVWERLVNDGLAEKVGDIKGDPEYSERESFPQFKTKLKNEGVSSTNTPADGNVQPRVEPMGEVRTTEQQSTPEESVPSAVDSGESKGDSEEKKPTTKEKIAERVKLSDAKIDDWKNAVKDIDSIFGIKIKVDDIEGLNKNGVDIVDVIANIAKQAVSAGIHIDEAIKKTIEHLKKTIDFEVDIEAVKERINPKKETSKELENFRDSWNREPSSDEYNKYDSGRTIEREHGELRNEQNYEIKKDLARVEIGLQAIEYAKKLFGAEYIEKTLEFLQEANLSPEKKAVGFVLLENEMDARVKAQPKSIGAKKLQDLVREKSQEFLANSARAIGAGRMRIERYRELAKNGFASEEFTNSLYSSQQLKDKAEIDKLVNISSEDLNKNDDSNITEEIKFEEPKVKRTKEAVKSDLKEALANMRKALNKSALDSMQVGIPYAKQIAVATPHIFKIAKLLAELGEMKTTEIVDFIHDELKEKFPSIGKKEITEILKSETAKTPKSKEEIKNNSIRETVKQALIDAGFYRNVKYKGEIVKRLDWKKIAGEENSVEKLRTNVEKSLKEKGLSQKEISKMSKALESEYNRLSEEIIEKGLKELESRNTPRKPVDMKSAAKKLAEYSNYGLFDKNRDSYEHLVNSVLGFNGLDQEAFVEMKQLAKAYVTLMNSGHTEVAMKSALNEINRKQAKLLGKLSFKQSNVTFKVLKVLAEITNLSTRFKLVNFGNLAENISSGVVARTINNLTDTFVNKVKGTETTNKKLSSQSQRNARSKLKGIVTDASESYGDTSSLLLNHSMLEDYLNEKSRNKLYHTIISAYMGRPVLEGADSYNKILITEAKMNRAVIKILEAKGMSNKEALSHVTEALTGESFETALVKAKDLIEKINTENGSKLLVDTKEAINALASDIVKDALLKGDTMTPKELEASYKAAYKSAGRDIGHVSNNWVSTQIGYVNSSIEKQITEAIKEKDWTKASIYTAYQIFWRNFMSTFVGGGTNWVVKQAQKSANPLSLISLVDDSLHRKGNLDITTDEGIKKMEEQLHREMNYRSTAGTIVFGTLAALTIFGAMKASGGDDDLNEWLKKNKWAKKFFDKMSPDVVVAMLAYKNKDMGRYFAKMLNVKADFFDDQKNILKVLKKYADGKNDEASGQLGGIMGKRFEFPGPLRLINDMQQIYKKETPDYGGVPSGFWNGFFANGILEKNDLRPDPNSEITKGSNKGRGSRSGRRNR